MRIYFRKASWGSRECYENKKREIRTIWTVFLEEQVFEWALIGKFLFCRDGEEGLPGRGTSVNTLVWGSTGWSCVSKGKSEWDTKKEWWGKDILWGKAREIDWFLYQEFRLYLLKLVVPPTNSHIQLNWKLRGNFVGELPLQEVVTQKIP